MRTLLSSIDMVIECRDYRVPLTSTNPLFEETLAGRERLVVYTKKDLGSNRSAADSQVSSVGRWRAQNKLLIMLLRCLERETAAPVAPSFRGPVLEP